MSQPEIDKNVQERMRNGINRHPLARKGVNTILRLAVRIQTGKDMRNPYFMPGLFEHSIIGNPLSYPADEEGTVTYESAPAGRFKAFEFHDDKTPPQALKVRPALVTGRLMAFLLEEVRDHDAEEQTPLGLLVPWNIDHLLQFNSHTTEQLVDQGLLRRTTYGEAYSRVGLYDAYAPELEARRVIDDTVFQVTPKGNTLVYIIADGGKAEPKEHRSSQPSWNPVLQPVPVIS